jgi:hypothetical protein
MHIPNTRRKITREDQPLRNPPAPRWAGSNSWRATDRLVKMGVGDLQRP